jgi:uncharacterized protein (TIGR03086 family)
LTSDLVAQLASAADAIGVVVGGIGADQWGRPTPCKEWNVRQLVEHLVEGNHRFVAAVSGVGEPRPPEKAPAEEPDVAFRCSADAVIDVFSQPGSLEQMVEVPFGTVPGAIAVQLRVTELLVHGWDLAKATGQPVSFPEDVTVASLAFTEPMLSKVPPERTPFAPPQPAPDDASPIDRLAACLGRNLTAEWGPGK